MNNFEIQNIINRYSERYVQYGYSPKTLGWDKGKQFDRYAALLTDFNLQNKRILDIGCGFGDAIPIIRSMASSFSYTGIDLVDALTNHARDKYQNDSEVNFITGEFLEHNFTDCFDIVVASGIFNHQMSCERDNIEFFAKVTAKAFEIAEEGVAFDFLSDKVDFKLEHTYHSSPESVLSHFYTFTRNIILKNNVMPFEFSLIGFIDDSFDSSDTLFKRYKNNAK